MDRRPAQEAPTIAETEAISSSIWTHDPPIFGSRAESPHQLAVGGAQAIDPAVAAAEEHGAAVHRRRGVDPPAGGEAPDVTSVGCAYAANAVDVLLGHPKSIADNHRL